MTAQDRLPNTRIRKAWRVSARDYDTSSIVYAASAGKARSHVYHHIDDGQTRIIDITARRAIESDVRLPQRDPIADLMSAEERECLLHAFGANQGDPTKAGSRDYFYTYRDDPPLVALTDRGLMKPMDGDRFGENMTYFVLTDAGKRVALSLTPEYAR